MNGMKALRLASVTFSICILLLAQDVFGDAVTNDVQINSLTVDGKQRPLHYRKSVNLGSSSREVSFGFEPDTNSRPAPFRIRYRLEGNENNWNMGGARMYLAIRFY